MPSSHLVLRTPFGPLTLLYEGARLTGIRFGPCRRDPTLCGVRVDCGTPLDRTARALIHDLSRYFSGAPTALSAPLDLTGHTDFQRAVWRATQAIPCGRTTTYGKLAADLGDRNASRAVGAALGQNPFPILIPCHRVVGSDGSLTGFGGGLEWKRALLGLESGQGEMF